MRTVNFVLPIVKQAASVALTALVFTTVGALTKKAIEAVEELFENDKDEDEPEVATEVPEDLLA